MRPAVMLLLVVLAFLAGVVAGRYYLPQPPPKAGITGPTVLRPGRLPATPGSLMTRPPAKPGPPPASQPPPAPPGSPPAPGPDTVRSMPPAPPDRLDPEELARQKRLKQELADSLREQGLKEEEIEAQVQGLFPPPPDLEELYSPYEESIEEKSPEELRAELAASLKKAGIPPEEIEPHVEAFMQHLQAEREASEQPQ